MWHSTNPGCRRVLVEEICQSSRPQKRMYFTFYCTNRGSILFSDRLRNLWTFESQRWWRRCSHWSPLASFILADQSLLDEMDWAKSKPNYFVFHFFIGEKFICFSLASRTWRLVVKWPMDSSHLLPEVCLCWVSEMIISRPSGIIRPSQLLWTGRISEEPVMKHHLGATWLTTLSACAWIIDVVCMNARSVWVWTLNGWKEYVMWSGAGVVSTRSIRKKVAGSSSLFCTLSLRLPGFSPGTAASCHSAKACTLGQLAEGSGTCLTPQVQDKW